MKRWVPATGGSVLLRAAVFTLTGAVLLFQNPNERPAAGMWTSPLDGPGSVLFENLNKTLGIEGLHFSVLNLAAVALLVAAIFVRPPPEAWSMPPDVRTLVGVAVAALLGVEVWGLVRAGDARQSLWQIQQLLTLPLLVLLFAAVIRGPDDFPAWAKLVLGCASAKAAVALYFVEVVCRREGWDPPHATTHSDTVLFVVALVLALGYWNERGQLSGWIHGLCAPCVLAGAYVNNRRMAWVSLAVCAAVLAAVSRRTRASVLLVRVGMLAGLGGLGFAAIGAGPKPEDRSALTRDIENYNLVLTLKHSPLGTGFGHPYEEISKADDISALFEQYRFIPHNSLLGLWAFGGLLGFAAIASLVATGIFLAALGYRIATGHVERTAALTCIAALITAILQAYGDMGFQSWTTIFIAALAVAVAAKLSVAVHAWPSWKESHP